MNIDHDTVKDLLEQAAEEIILPRFNNLHADDIQHKAADDVVTIADREAEIFLTQNLPKLIDGSLVVGEEATHEDEKRLEVLEGDAPVWVIDPLDGTGNFAAGDDRFALMVCLIVQGETRAAWIYQPVPQILTSAELGGGAFADGERLHIQSQAQPLSQLRGALLTRFLPDNLRPTAQAAASEFDEIFMSRCGGFDYPAFASGQLQFLFYYKTLVWDHAPGSLIATEAGGIVRRLDGSKYHPTDQRSGLLVADNIENWRNIQQQVVPAVESPL
jgi:fructose-1,6-bisphosphatase/inositol monophosphatase family enzyme